MRRATAYRGSPIKTNAETPELFIPGLFGNPFCGGRWSCWVVFDGYLQGCLGPAFYFTLPGVARHSHEILKSVMCQPLDHPDGATQFARSCRGGGCDTSLPWNRKEDDRRFAYRNMMQARKMLKPSQPKRGVGGRR